MTARANAHLRNQIVRGYHILAESARYRPAAPSDGCGSVLLDDKELRDPGILRDEATRYAIAFCEADEAMLHEVHGCVHSGLGIVQMLALEAATLCNAGSDAEPFIRRILELAIERLKLAS